MSTLTPLIDQAALGDHLDADLMFKFFAAFSRFEYALKASRPVVEGKDKAEPDWAKFSRDIDCQFLEQGHRDPELKGALDALVAAPPKIQTPDLRWVEVTPQEPKRGAMNALLMVRRVRNNLFHGGKAQRQAADGQRDNRLVQNSLIVLDRALKIDRRVSDAFLTI